ncbi:hypothetical protein D3C72_1917180 [compost metagenome]
MTHRTQRQASARPSLFAVASARPNQPMRTTSFEMNMAKETTAACSTSLDGFVTGTAPAARMMIEIRVSEIRACLSKYCTTARPTEASSRAQPAARGSIQIPCANQASPMPRMNRGRARQMPRFSGI